MFLSARKDARKFARPELRIQAESVLAASSKGPFLEPPAFKPLQGDLTSSFSRRLNYQHRMVYRAFESTREVKIIEMWTGYIQSTRQFIINIMLKYGVKEMAATALATFLRRDQLPV